MVPEGYRSIIRRLILRCADGSENTECSVACLLLTAMSVALLTLLYGIRLNIYKSCTDYTCLACGLSAGCLKRRTRDDGDRLHDADFVAGIFGRRVCRIARRYGAYTVVADTACVGAELYNGQNRGLGTD